MSSHRFLFVRDHEKFFNWSASIIALNLTKEALYEYMEEIADRYVRGLATDEKNHIVDFIEHNRRYFPNRDGKALMMEKLKCSCIPCASLYKRIQDDLLGSPESSVLLETPENVGRSKLWWILLKMNSRHAGKDTQQIEDCDLKLLCRIVQRCRLFAPVKNIEKVIAYRNMLMHNSSNEISTETKRSYLSVLEELLESPGLKGRPKISGMKFHNSRFHSTYEDCDELKQSMKWQIEAIEKDMEEFNRKHLNVIKLEEIMRIIKKNKDTVTVEQRKIIEGRKVATLDEAVEIGKQDGEQALKAGGFVGECVGGLAGGAGAWVAGNVRKQ
ncbi:uncharacterized protein LOC128554057 isoform X2 [Mercenaria mercenaria]|uniref:uncharacterized protein LOC128554057 isoform X2 n=1 Tax=Mercenaria mercenaria TaxID=6596 RepID=UPI00234E5997|nr:uncharacterized protein LOC128554057 isoform X2 [Mercenaria mercenaria]